MLKFILKWLVNGAIVVALLLYYTDIGFWNAALAATGLTVVSYLIGDQFLLRTTNNFFAALCDIVLAAIYLAVLSYGFSWDLSWGETAFIAFLIGVAEWVLHRFLFNEEFRVAG
jgi:hypothetical protein